ncbi:DUF1269 domain-containing protein [Herbidospora daliensis]|uniref:DUF1269 domain-containing protein n=1 Tax=Herbidospora daliensis TaxID=295585 RepID=UPI000782386C|nr:DUF1269 domain-containing protein [Herbidospora daliensis]
MATLIAIAYDDLGTAVEVRDKLFRLQQERLITLTDAAIVEHTTEGKIKMKPAVNMAATGAAGGALWGGLIGLIFFMPLVGAAVGAATGALVGAKTDIGVDDKFMKDVAAGLVPGGAALFLLVEDSTRDKVLPQVAPMGGRIIHTSLTQEAENQLKEAIEAARHH